MTKSIVKSILYLFFLLILGTPIASNSATGDYDGNWSAAINCGINSLNGYPAFTRRAVFIVNQGSIEFNEKIISSAGEEVNNFSGRIANNVLTIAGQGRRDKGGAWDWQFVSEKIGVSNIDLNGYMLANKKPIRDCHIAMQKISDGVDVRNKKTNPIESGLDVNAENSRVKDAEKKQADFLNNKFGAAISAIKDPGINSQSKVSIPREDTKIDASQNKIEKPKVSNSNAQQNKRNFEYVSQAFFDLSIIFKDAEQQSGRIENAIYSVDNKNGLQRRFANIFSLTSDFEKKLGGWLEKYPRAEGNDSARTLFYRVLPKNIKLLPSDENELFAIVGEKHDILKKCLLVHYLKYSELMEKIDNIEEPRREKYKGIVQNFDRLSSQEKTKRQFPNPEPQPDLVAPLEDLFQANNEMMSCGESARKVKLLFK